MTVLNNIKYIFDLNKFKERYKMGNNENLNKSLKDLVEKVLPYVNPKAIYNVSFIEQKLAESVKIDGVEFNSKVLRENLTEIERVFPFIVTCGHEIDEQFHDIDNYLDRYWLDALKEDAMRYASEYLKKHLKQKYDIKKLASMNPGSGNLKLWPISEQKKLFSLFGNVEDLIGVKLTDSFLMIPNKSVSGIYFPTNIKYVNCQYCSREKCPNRQAAYINQIEEG